MPAQGVAMSEKVNGANGQEQNPSSAPPASTIGTLDTSLTATAGPGTQPEDSLPEASTTSQETSHHLSGGESTSRFSQGSLACPTTSSDKWNAAHYQDSGHAVSSETPLTPSTNVPVEQRDGTGSTDSTSHVPTDGNEALSTMAKPSSSSTPASRGRGRGRGRPRSTGTCRGGGRRSAGRVATKRKRNHDDDEGNDANNDDGSDSSEVYTPIATITKSGRSIQKPTSYVPPPPQSPVNSSKRKRTYRKNPESAVCKICQRGTSPAKNMIVFCDGCNMPYHRYCHHPPIDQAVIDEVDMEWYCRQCEKRRVAPVPESEVAGFVSAEGSSMEERRKYFSRMKPGMMVTLLARTAALHPELPLFDPDFGAKYNKPEAASGNTLEKGSDASKPVLSSSKAPASIQDDRYIDDVDNDEDEDDEADDEGYDASFHPPNYPKPGQGLMATLPPDKDDTDGLVDDRDHLGGAFTHIYRAEPDTAAAAAAAKTV